jgi:hypothetical protein
VTEETGEKVVISVEIAEVVVIAVDVVVDLAAEAVPVVVVAALVDRVAAEEDNVRMCQCADVQIGREQMN